MYSHEADCTQVIDGKECAERDILQPEEMCSGCKLYWTTVAGMYNVSVVEYVRQNNLLVKHMGG